MAMFDVDKTIRQIIVNWYKNVMFLDTEFMSVDEFVDHIIFELIKKAYEITDKPKSIRAHLLERNMDTEDQRVMYNRIMRHAQYYRDLQYENHSSWGLNVEELKAPDMKVMENRLGGYQLTNMQFFELTQMHELDIIKACSTKRICDTKKISNTRFKEMYAAFDEMVEKLRDGAVSDSEVIFNAIAYFTLEWTMAYEMVYNLAEKAEEYGFPDVDKEKIVWLCGDVELSHAWPTLLEFDTIGDMRSQSRFCLYRHRLFPALLDDFSDWTEVLMHMVEYLRVKTVIHTGTIDEMKLSEWFVSQTTEAERAEFIRSRFWLFDIHKEKTWSNKRIKYARQIFEAIYKDITPPQIQ